MQREPVGEIPETRARELVADELGILVDEIEDPLMGMSPEKFAQEIGERDRLARIVKMELQEMHARGERKAALARIFQRREPIRYPIRCYPSSVILSPVALEQMQRFCREHPHGEVAAKGWINSDGKVSSLQVIGEGNSGEVKVDCLVLEADIQGEKFEVLIHSHLPQTGTYMSHDEWRLDASAEDMHVAERLARFGWASLICDHECLVVRIVEPGYRLVCPPQRSYR